MAVLLSAAAFALTSCIGSAFRYRRQVQPHPGDGPAGKVVTLGDSYSAGTGIHTYGYEYDEEFGGYMPPFEFTYRPDRACWRDKTTTPGARYAASHSMEAIMMACNGARREYVDNQFDYLQQQYPADAAAKWNNSVLLVGLGGNDLRTVRGESWPSLLVRCVTERPCHENPLNQVANFGSVEDVLFQLFFRLAQDAAAATIRVTGYPRLFQRAREGSWYDQGCWNVVWIVQEEADWIDSQVDLLDAYMEAAVRRVKATFPQVDIEYISLLDYVNRGACANSDERMVNKEVLTWSGISDASFHMSQLGFDQVYRAFMDSLSA